MSSQIGPLLRGLRLEVGLTQEQLARQAGLGVRTVQRLETGKPTDSRLGTVRQLAHVLADASGRERDGVWQELLAAHRDQGSGSASPVVAPAPDVPLTRPLPEPVGLAGPAPRSDLAEVARSLAYEVHSRWMREEEQRRIHDPFPLPVRWRSAPEELLDHWDNIGGAAPGATSGALCLDGGLAQITDRYRSVRSGRLVVLGRAGSGKTVLMLRFVLDYLGTRLGDDPVPVVFSIGSWDPTALGLRDWLIDRLLRDHPNLAAAAPGHATLAAALVDAGWILPVLDGFDEIAAGLHCAALGELNAITLPLLLTSRTEQFAAAVATDVLRKAAGIELADLTTDDLAHYLPRTARPTGEGEQAGRAATVWDPVLDELRSRPDSRATAALATVLSTPLMVLLARTLYSDIPGQDPAELLDTDRFPTPEAIEGYLLAGFVPTVYRQRPAVRAGGDAPHPGRGWELQGALHYLGGLAGHLDRPGQRNRQDLAWWQLSCLLSLRSRVLAVFLACTAVTIVCTQVVENVIRPSSHVSWVPIRLPISLVNGLAVGLAFGFVYGIAVVSGKGPFGPCPVRLQLPRRGRRRAGAPARELSTAFGAGGLMGATAGVAYGFTSALLVPGSTADSLSGAPRVEVLLISSLLYATIYGAAGCLALGLMTALETPLDPVSVATPGRLLAVNRTTAIRQALLVAPVITVAVAAASRALDLYTLGWWGSLLLGLECGVVGTLCYILAFTAWGQWVLFTRIALPLTGRLPWATMAFLDDAYQRGVLRQVGAVYQFRHARLQHHLSPAPRTSDE